MKMFKCTKCMMDLGGAMRFCPHCGYDQQREEQPANALRRNTILHGRYWVGNVIGQGGFGITYVGFDLVLEMRVAIKEYYPSSAASRTGSHSSRIQWDTRDEEEQAKGVARFVKEARKMAKLDAVPSIVRVWDVLQENDTAYIVMDYVEGVTLKRYLLAHGVMRPEECFVLLDPILESLAVMHGRGFIHRDISPDNIMIQPDGTARLLDMGAAMDMRATQGQASMPVAKKYFSAPEQYLESETLENCTDVYAMAATIYYCLTGRVVPEAMERLYSETPLSFPENSQIPDGIAAALIRALEVKKSQRTGDMRAFRRQLKDALQEQSPGDAEKELRKQEAETDSGDVRKTEIRSEESGKPSEGSEPGCTSRTGEMPGSGADPASAGTSSDDSAQKCGKSNESDEGTEAEQTFGLEWGVEQETDMLNVSLAIAAIAAMIVTIFVGVLF